MVYQVDAGHFCAGLIVNRYGVVADAAPVLRWTLGHELAWLRGYCARVGWRLRPCG